MQNSLSQTQIVNFKLLAQQGELLFPTIYEQNYVYVGRGQTPSLRSVLNCDVRTFSSFDYFISKEDWVKIFGEFESIKKHNVNAIKNLGSLIKKANNFIGKKILSVKGDNVGTSLVVDQVNVYFDLPYGTLTKKFFEEHGFYIWMTSTDSKKILYTPEEDTFKVVERCFIQNDRGETLEVDSLAEFWKIGMDYIPKKLLQELETLSKMNFHVGTTNFSKVTIGSFTFDISTIKKLNNLEK